MTWAADAPLPAAPMPWAAPDTEFADLALDEDGPVYRNLGLATLMTGGVETELNFDDEPVYRSIGGFGADADIAANDEPALGRQAASPADTDRSWLETMPPLVKRQRAHGPSILLG